MKNINLLTIHSAIVIDSSKNTNNTAIFTYVYDLSIGFKNGIYSGARIGRFIHTGSYNSLLQEQKEKSLAYLGLSKNNVATIKYSYDFKNKKYFK